MTGKGIGGVTSDLQGYRPSGEVRRDTARSALSVGSVEQDQFLEGMKAIALSNLEQPLGAGSVDGDRPELSEPAVSESGELRKLVESLSEILEAADDLPGLKGRADAWNEMSASAEKELKGLSDTFTQAVADANAATTRAVQADMLARSAHAALELAEGEPHAEEFVFERRSEADHLSNEAATELNRAIELTIEAYGCEQRLNEAIEASEQANKGLRFDLSNESASEQLNGAAMLSYVLATLSKLIGDSSVAGLETKRELFEKMQQKRSEESQAKLAAYDSKMKSIERWSTIIGTVSEILGWVIFAATFAAGVATGGLGLLFALGGLAVLGLDQLGKLATGESLLNKLVSPVMDKVVSPLIGAIASQVSKMLVACGCDEKTAEVVAAVVAAAVTAAVVIAAVVAFKSLGSKICKVCATKLAQTKLVQAAIKLATKIANSSIFNRGNLLQLQKLGVNLQRGALASGAVATATQGVAGGLIGGQQASAADLLADTKKAQYDVEMLSRLLEEVVKVFVSETEEIMKLLARMSQAGQQERSTNAFVWQNVRA